MGITADKFESTLPIEDKLNNIVSKADQYKTSMTTMLLVSLHTVILKNFNRSTTKNGLLTKEQVYRRFKLVNERNCL